MGVGNLFADVNLAHRMKAVIRSIVKKVLDEQYPAPRYATVDEVDLPNSRATVIYPDEPGNPVSLPITALAPDAGNMVRVSGPRGARYIDEVIDGGFFSRSGGGLKSGIDSQGIYGGIAEINFPVPYATSCGSVVGTPVTGDNDKYLLQIAFLSETGFGFVVLDSTTGTPIPGDGESGITICWMATGT